MGLILLSLAAAATFGSTPPSVEWVTDSTVNPPGITGNFFIEMPAPVPCGNLVLFNGSTIEDSRIGTYAATPNGIEVIANASTPVPGSSGQFEEAWRESCGDSRVVFAGDDDLSPASLGSSLYSWSGGSISLLLAAGTTIGPIQLAGLNDVDAKSDRVAVDARFFSPGITQALVLASSTEPPQIVADLDDTMPGQTDPVTIYARPTITGTDLVFHARTGSNLGLYRWTAPSSFAVVADTTTQVPGEGGTTFGIFDVLPASLDYGTVFGGGYLGGHGLFLSSDGELEALVAPGAVTAEGETITAAFLPTGAGSLLSFRATTVERPQESVFVRTPDGTLWRLLGVGDTIDGEVVGTVNVSASAHTVAMRVDFFGPPWIQAIYKAEFGGEPALVEIPTLMPIGLIAYTLALGAMAVMIIAATKSRLVN
ncbi:MAG: hypothetical protein K8J08_16215 [Thermoanaerobaculia bacterium]|nr:hypothetical protein [Thermoanaerobaculia bacterium]